MTEFKVKIRDNIVVVSPIGGLTAAHHLQDLTNQLDKYIQKNYQKYVIKMTEVTSVDSAALGVLFGFHKRVLSVQGKTIVCEIPERLHRVFKVMDFDQIIHICDTLEEAIAELSLD